jgi:cytochrome c oxidase subunit 1
MIFSALTFSVSIPSAIKVFNWLATMYRGNITLQTPMCYALSFIVLFGIGGLTGLFLGALSTDIHLHDTYFVVAHFHYTMMGGVVIGFLGALHYWWPKMTGRMYSEFWGRLACLIMFIAFNLTFFTQFVMGSHGMPRRYANYLDRFQPYHVVSSIGAFLLGLSFVIVAAYLIHSLFRGRRAPANPWGSPTLEWRCKSPPPHNNFDTPPPVGDPYDFSGIEYDPEKDEYVDHRPMTAEATAPH